MPHWSFSLPDFTPSLIFNLDLLRLDPAAAEEVETRALSSELVQAPADSASPPERSTVVTTTRASPISLRRLGFVLDSFGLRPSLPSHRLQLVVCQCVPHELPENSQREGEHFP